VPGELVPDVARLESAYEQALRSRIHTPSGSHNAETVEEPSSSGQPSVTEADAAAPPDRTEN